MDLKLSKKLKNDKKETQKISVTEIYTSIRKGIFSGTTKDSFSEISTWSYLFPIGILVIFFVVAVFRLVDLQLVNGQRYAARAENNQIEIEETTPFRGVIYDVKGKKLAENIPSMNLYLDLREYRDTEGYISDDELRDVSKEIEVVLGDVWKSGVSDDELEYSSLGDFMLSEIERLIEDQTYYATEKLLIMERVGNKLAIKIKSDLAEVRGILVDDSYSRKYIGHPAFAHLLGYTSRVTAEDMDELDYVSPVDIVGRTGVEKVYDKQLFGTKGEIARERNAAGEILADSEVLLKEEESGESLYLTIDYDSQVKMYDLLANAVARYGADGGAGIIQDVNTGEIKVLASYPSYDNNLFVGGISQEDFEGLLYGEGTPLTNKAIAAQVPAGSTFKTVVAASMLEAGEIDRNHTVLSTSNYEFSDGAPFQEYENHAYGLLDLVDALTVSSNIYFCDVIRDWDMNELVPYLEKFGIGQYTYIDVPGEGIGRLPSPANKIALGKELPWLDAIWYPEGDACNSVIGQGITLVTPIQMVNWTSSIANGGTLHMPKVGGKTVDVNGDENLIINDPLRFEFMSDASLKIVREGMWSTVNGSRRVIAPLTDAPVTVAGKTGTAEFGRLIGDRYEFTHAWVTGFYPYENPQYSFTIFLEGGGASNNSAQVMRDYLDWEYDK